MNIYCPSFEGGGVIVIGNEINKSLYPNGKESGKDA